MNRIDAESKSRVFKDDATLRALGENKRRTIQPDFDEGALRQSLMRLRARMESAPKRPERTLGPITPIRPDINID